MARKRTIWRTGTAVLAAAFVLFTTAIGAKAEVKEFAVKGYTISQEISLPITPDSLFDKVTGDISGWWDHHFSENPKHLYIEPKPGGGFYEIFDKQGNGAKHATVILAERGKRLRFEGPLGLSGSSVMAVTSYDFAPDSVGCSLKVTVNISGQIDENLAKAVDGVWHHFLYERLKPFIENKGHIYEPRK